MEWKIRAGHSWATISRSFFSERRWLWNKENKFSQWPPQYPRGQEELLCCDKGDLTFRDCPVILPSWVYVFRLSQRNENRTHPQGWASDLFSPRSCHVIEEVSMCLKAKNPCVVAWDNTPTRLRRAASECASAQETATLCTASAQRAF